jgi:anti-anti-sigma regulatory factor
VAKTTKTSGARTIKIAPDLRIAGARAAYAVLRDAAGRPESRIALDGRQVEKVDAAGIQAILAGRRVLGAAGKKITWSGTSTQLETAAGLLGLAEALGLSE